MPFVPVGTANTYKQRNDIGNAMTREWETRLRHPLLLYHLIRILSMVPRGMAHWHCVNTKTKGDPTMSNAFVPCRTASTMGQPIWVAPLFMEGKDENLDVVAPNSRVS